MITYIVGNNQDLIKSLDNESISLTITSPPYKDSDGFNDIDFHQLFSELYRVHKNNTLFFLNFGHLANFKERPFQVMLKALEAGWKLNDTIVWLKSQFSPIQGNKRVNNLTEFIFLLYKGEMPDLDRLSIGVPYMDKANIGRYSENDLRCRGNIWHIPYPTINKKSQKPHPDYFPIDLPTKCIKLSGIKSGIVLDIFCGSGTTLVASKSCGLDGIGFEKNSIYQEIFQNRIK